MQRLKTCQIMRIWSMGDPACSALPPWPFKAPPWSFLPFGRKTILSMKLIASFVSKPVACAESIYIYIYTRNLSRHNFICLYSQAFIVKFPLFTWTHMQWRLMGGGLGGRPPGNRGDAPPMENLGTPPPLLERCRNVPPLKNCQFIIFYLSTHNDLNLK